jgi:hypothetical protein
MILGNGMIVGGTAEPQNVAHFPSIHASGGCIGSGAPYFPDAVHPKLQHRVAAQELSAIFSAMNELLKAKWVPAQNLARIGCAMIACGFIGFGVGNYLGVQQLSFQ